MKAKLAISRNQYEFKRMVLVLTVGKYARKTANIITIVMLGTFPKQANSVLCTKSAPHNGNRGTYLAIEIVQQSVSTHLKNCKCTTDDESVDVIIK